MKLITTIVSIAATTFALSSCSDKLSNSKAEDLIEGCVDKSKEEIAKIYLGSHMFNSISDKDEISKYLELQKEGYLKLTNEGKGFMLYDVIYKIELLPKSDEYVVKKTPLTADIKFCDVEVLEVKDIHEIPSFNVAEVNVKFARKNFTPFKILSKVETEYSRKWTLTKNNDGWTACKQ